MTAEPMLFRIGNRRMWMHFGDYLISGRTTRYHLSPAPMDLERFGPFVPPLYMTHTRAIVSNATRLAIERDRPFDVGFRRTHYERVLPLGWHEWDFDAPYPPVIPTNRDPGYYYFDVMDRMTDSERTRVSAELAQEMEQSWELVLPVIPCDVRWLGNQDELEVTLLDEEYKGLFYSSDREIYPLADVATKRWFEANVGPWAHFEPVKTICQT